MTDDAGHEGLVPEAFLVKQCRAKRRERHALVFRQCLGHDDNCVKRDGARISSKKNEHVVPAAVQHDPAAQNRRQRGRKGKKHRNHAVHGRGVRAAPAIANHGLRNDLADGSAKPLYKAPKAKRVKRLRQKRADACRSKNHHAGHHCRLAAIGIRERADEKTGNCVGDEINRHRLLHGNKRGAEISGHFVKARHIGVDRKRPQA